MPKIRCLNCESAMASRYCPECGQKGKVGRLTLKNMVHDFAEAVFHAESGYLQTVQQLTRAPGEFIRAYLRGQRAHRVSAGKYTVFTLFLFALSFSLLTHHFRWEENFYAQIAKAEKNFKQESAGPARSKAAKVANLDLVEGVNIEFLGAVLKSDKGDSKDYRFTFNGREKLVPKDRIFEFIRLQVPTFEKVAAKYVKLSLLLWIPLISLMCFLIFHRWHWNLAEHLTAQSYIFSHALFLLVILSPIYWILPSHSGSVFVASISVAMAYYMYALMDLAPDAGLRSKKRIFLTYALSAFLMIFLFSGLTAVVSLKTMDLAMAMPFP